MEQMLWDAACSIRGEKDAAKYKDYILPLLFIKRLSDVFDDEIQRLAETYGDADTALSILESDHSLVRFYIPREARWSVVSGRENFDWSVERRPKSFEHSRDVAESGRHHHLQNLRGSLRAFGGRGCRLYRCPSDSATPTRVPPSRPFGVGVCATRRDYRTGR